jgi:xeroderma pigmentosum group C-complementing protein
MVGRKRNTPQRGARQQANRGGGGNEPDIYQQMLAEAGVSAPAVSSPERPLKRRRGVASSPDRAVSEKAEPAVLSSLSSSVGEASRSKTEKPGDGDEEAEEDDDEMEFEDVAIPEPTLQTLELDSDDDEEDEDEALQFEDVQFNMPLPDEASQSQEPQELELNLSAQKSAMTSKQGADRRKPLKKEEKERRIDIHKTHLLCLLTHVAKRNHWCNDAQVQESLRPHLTDKMVQYLTPGTNLSQFGRTESLKNGLKLVADMWKNKFEITERGMRRALWAEKVEDLDSVCVHHPQPWHAQLLTDLSMNSRMTWNHVWINLTLDKQRRRCKAHAMSEPSCTAPCYEALVFVRGSCVHYSRSRLALQGLPFQRLKQPPPSPNRLPRPNTCYPR